MGSTARAANLRVILDLPRRAVAYLRQSTAKEETISDEIQRAAIEAYATRNNIIIVAEIWEQRSGRVWHKRKGVIKAMGMVESGEVQIILLWRWNRLSRKRLHWAVAEDRVAQLGGTIESATEPSDVTTASGRLSRNVLVDLAEFDSDSIGEGWIATHEYRRNRGLPATGRERYAYTWFRGKGEVERYEIDRSRSRNVDQMFDLWSQGYGGRYIARELNIRNCRTVTGSLWSERTVLGYLDSGFPFGLLARVPNKEGGGPILTPFSSREWLQGAHEPILGGDCWETYKRFRTQRAPKTTAPRSLNPAHPLSGMLQCGACGSTMQRSSRGGPNPGYQFRCARARFDKTAKLVTIAEKRLLARVLTWLEELADDVDGSAQAQAVEVNRRLASADAELAVARAELTRIDNQLVKLTRQLLDETTPQLVHDLTQAELLVERQVAEEQVRVAALAAAEPVVDPVITARGLLAEWDTLSVGRRRQMLQKLIRVVYVDRSTAARGSPDLRIVPTWAAE